MPVEPIVVATHTDIMGSVVDRFRLRGETDVFARVHEPILRAGGVQVFCDHLGGDSRYGYIPATGLATNPLQRAMRMFDHAQCEADGSESLVVVRSVADIYAAAAEGRLAMIMGMEGGSPLQGELTYLHAFYRLGLRSLGITHNWRNALADGCLERSRGGLTHFGQAVVRECNELGIAVDVSHLALEGVRDVLGTTSMPIIASHTNPSAVREHPHNLSDDLLRAIAETGGFVGVFVLNSYLSDDSRPSMSAVSRAVGHLIETIGIEHVGIAPDVMENWDQAEFKRVTEGSRTFESVPVSPIEYEYPDGFATLADLPVLRAAIGRDLQLSDAELDLIFGLNSLRVYERIWRG
ncbi:MAG: dipeptidase [Gaiellales bacterium]